MSKPMRQKQNGKSNRLTYYGVALLYADFRIGGFTNAELAERHGLSVQTVKNRHVMYLQDIW